MTFYPHERVFADSPVELLGIIGIIALLISGLLALYRHWRATECHIDGCHKHQWKLLPGTDHILCKPHHEAITGKKAPTHAEAHAAHVQAGYAPHTSPPSQEAKSMRTKINLKGTITIGIPTIAALILGLLAGVAQVINEAVLEASSQWHAYITVILVFAAGIGISPLVGPAFRAALHLPAWAGYLISAAMAAAVLALSTVSMATLPHAIVAAVLTVLAALGFAPSSIAVVPPPPATQRARL